VGIVFSLVSYFLISSYLQISKRKRRNIDYDFVAFVPYKSGKKGDIIPLKNIMNEAFK